MARASELFSEEQRKQVEQAVGEAESKTSCEIVPVVVTSSGRYERSEDLVGLLFALAAAILVWVILPRESSTVGTWGDGMPFIIELLVLVIALVLAFILGAFVGNRITWVKRLFTPEKQMREEVYSRAREVFFDKRVHHTEDGTGLLVFLSLMEHQAVVLGDQTVLDKKGQSFLDELCKKLIDAIHASSMTESLCAVIIEAGNQLSEPLPQSGDVKNELPNALILLD